MEKVNLFLFIKLRQFKQQKAKRKKRSNDMAKRKYIFNLRIVDFALSETKE
jgi:hypothetical protein